MLGEVLCRARANDGRGTAGCAQRLRHASTAETERDCLRSAELAKQLIPVHSTAVSTASQIAFRSAKRSKQDERDTTSQRVHVYELVQAHPNRYTCALLYAVDRRRSGLLFELPCIGQSCKAQTEGFYVVVAAY